MNILNEFNVLSIKESNGYNIHPIHIIHDTFKNIKKQTQTEDFFNCYASTKTIVKPYEKILIEANIGKNNKQKIQENSVFFLCNKTNQKKALHLTEGIFDNNPIEQVIIQNTSNFEQKIEKGQKLEMFI
ncbi:hypothetical protein GVAV_002775 [Gurleya vavrai]